jgi:hypothetical protein
VKPLLRLFAGWLLMFSGAAAMLDASVRWQREAPALVYGLTFAGFAVCVAGWFLRRSALRPAPPRLNLL